MIGEENLFQNVLASFQARRGWTQEDAAAHIEVSRSTYSGWITGKNIPPSKQLLKIAAGFKLNQTDQETLNRAAAHTPPRIHTLPFPHNPFFTGREAYLNKLGQLFRENDSIALTQPVSISGLGGIGKTQLALEYAHQSYRTNVYQAVFWVDAADMEALQTSYVKLAHRLELPERAEQERVVIVQAVKDWLERHTNWLLIMDNADDLELTRSFFPKASHELAYQGRILLTTRSQIADDVVGTQIEIDKMEPSEGLLFLLRRTHKLEGNATPDTVAADIRGAALQVVDLLDGHPLALDQAGAYIHEARVSFADYIKLYYETRHDLLEMRWLLDDEHRDNPEYSQHPETVAATFELCFKQACARHSLAGDILDFCAFLYPDAIPEELFQHDASFNYGTTEFNTAIAALLRYSLVKRNDQEKTLSLHRLVQAVLIDTISPNLQKLWRERVVRALNAAFPKEGIKSWEQFERLLPHALVCTTLTDDKLTPTAEVAELLETTGRYLLGTRGQYNEVEPLLFRAFGINVQYFGLNHPVTIRSRDTLALMRSVYRDFGEHTIPYDVLVLNVITRLWVLQYGEEAIENAEALYQHALYEQEQQLGAKHPLVRETRIGYAAFLDSIGRVAEAEALLMNDEPSV